MQNVTTVVFVLFLAVLASFGSFWLSRYAHARHQTSLGWTALAIGTVLLLAAVSTMVMTSSRLSFVSWLAQVDEKALVGSPSADAPASRASPFQRLAPDMRVPNRQVARKHVSSDLGSEASNRHRAESGQREPTPRADAVPAMSDLAKRQSGKLAFDASDPWAATRCVIPIRRDPAHLTKWTIENDCPAAVAIVIATCSDSPGCDGDAMHRWTYEVRGVVLPEKRQRTVIEQEQTFYGERLERLACALSSARAIELIGESSEMRATEEWQRDFEEARGLDDCLAWVTRLSEHGRRTGVPIHALIGGARLSSLTN
jgi:hypothetical protein